MNILKSIILCVIAFCVILAGPIPAYAVEVIDPGLCNGAVNPDVICKDKVTNPQDNPIYGPEGVLTKSISILSVVIAVISIVMIVIAGIRMSISQGESQKVISARNTIIYAGVGIAVAAVAQGIVQLVLNRL